MTLLRKVCCVEEEGVSVREVRAYAALTKTRIGDGGSSIGDDGGDGGSSCGDGSYSNGVSDRRTLH